MQTDGVRIALSTLACALALALPAAAADVNPKALVLQPGDVSVPRLVRQESGVQTNAALSKNDPEARALIPRTGRITGYVNLYEYKDGRSLWSWADVLRKPSGARVLLAHTDREMLEPGTFRRTSVDVGRQAWLYAKRTGEPTAVVAWRHGRVFAVMGAEGLSTGRVLALARIQQRRIANALG
jgi:hypothetical protein